MTSTTPVERPGRPLALTDAVQDKVVTAIKAGSYLSVAATYAGVSDRSLQNWLARGRRGLADLQRGQGVDDNTERCVRFLRAVTQAEAQAEVAAAAAWRSAWADDWRAARDYLVRKHPERWAATVRVQISEAEQEQRIGSAVEQVLAALAGDPLDTDPVDPEPVERDDAPTEGSPQWDEDRGELVRVIEGAVASVREDGSGDVPPADQDNPGGDPDDPMGVWDGTVEF